MTAWEILTTPLENLVPPARAGRLKLPRGVGAPKNTIAAGRLRQLVFGTQISEDAVRKGLLREMVQRELQLFSK
jgi:hypothetical protein